MPFSTNPSPLPFDRIAVAVRKAPAASRIAILGQSLETSSITEYSKAFPNHGEILQFQDHGFTYLFDLQNSDTDSRVIAVYGLSKTPTGKRDSSRQKGFVATDKDDPNRIFGKGLFDRGHFMAHSIGGGMDVNFFPQNPPLNRGWSNTGKLYREMEKQVAANPNTFVFARPIYTDDTWVPTYLEYAVLESDGNFWSALFPN
jgi:hypothetical protein